MLFLLLIPIINMTLLHRFVSIEVNEKLIIQEQA